MNASLVLIALTLGGPAVAITLSPAWELPAGSKIYKETTALAPEHETLKVVFYYKEMEWAAATVLTPAGQQVASVRLDLPHGFEEPTGVFGLKGDGSTQIVIFGRVGAKAGLARVYQLEGARLKAIFDWSGWDFRILLLRGRAVIAARLYAYGSPTDLYLWAHGRFERGNELFPDFYVPEIRSQERIIRQQDATYPGQFAQACHVVAQALLYGRRYGEAVRQCHSALVAIQSQGLSKALSLSPPEVAAADRERAVKDIRGTISRILMAKRKGLTQLPP